jgi:hypothetical protein
MITGKNSALKGFALFAWLVVAILTLIGCANYNAFFGVAGLVNLVLNSIVIIKLFTHFSAKK